MRVQIGGQTVRVQVQSSGFARAQEAIRESAAAQAAAEAAAATINANRIPRGALIGRRVGFLGTSITNGSNADNTDLAYTRQALEMAGTAIVARVEDGGSTVSGNPGAKSAVIKTYLAEILSAGCDIVVLEVGANDTGQGESLADYYAPNMLEMFNAVKAAGRSLYVLTVPPRGSAAAPTTAQLKAIDSYNLWLRLVVPSYGTLIDINRAMIASASTQLMDAAYDSGDGVHPNSTGHRLMARLLAEKWRTFQRPGMVNVINGNNLVSNPFFLADSATGWFELPGGTGDAPTYSFVADTEEQLTVGQWREIDFAPGAGAGSRIYSISLGNASSTTWEIGDVLAVCAQVQIEDVAGNWETIGQGGTGTGGVSLKLINGGSGAGLSESAITGRLYPIGTDLYAIGPTWLTYTMASSPAPLSLWLTVSLPAGANLKVRVGEVGVINLTKSGLADAPLS
jgi:lysophospholipase L1-like esterase